MIKLIHQRNIDYTAGLIFFIGTACQKKANLTGFIILASPNSIYAFNKLQKHLSSIIKTAQKMLSNNTFHGSIIYSIKICS